METHEVAADLATLARQAHERHEAAQQEEIRRRIEARRRELEQAARARVREVLAAVEIDPDAIEVQHTHADAFDQFGGHVRLTVDGVPMLYAYDGPHAGPSLAVVTTCTTCGEETPGDTFESLAELGAALARPRFSDPERIACGCNSGRRTADTTGTPNNDARGRDDR